MYIWGDVLVMKSLKYAGLLRVRREIEQSAKEIVRKRVQTVVWVHTEAGRVQSIEGIKSCPQAV